MIQPNQIAEIMMDKSVISKKYIQRFKEMCVSYIDEHIKKSDWYHSDNHTAEIPFLLWHENFPELLSKDAYSVFPEIIKMYKDAGWHTFTSTGAQKMFYITLTPQDLWEKRNKDVPKEGR